MNAPQVCRLLKAECIRCGYLIRLTMKWVNFEHPKCPRHGENMAVEWPEPKLDAS